MVKFVFGSVFVSGLCLKYVCNVFLTSKWYSRMSKTGIESILGDLGRFYAFRVADAVLAQVWA